VRSKACHDRIQPGDWTIEGAWILRAALRHALIVKRLSSSNLERFTSTTQDKKLAFITGGNRGIGLETASQLGVLGIFPVIGARSANAGKTALASLREEGVEADYILFNVTNKADHQKAYDYFENKAGRLDILINNAGAYLESGPGRGTVSTLPENILRDTFEINFFGPVAITQTLLPLIRKSPAGRIVNLVSLFGSLTLGANTDSPAYAMKSFAYDTSKTAPNSFTVQLARELKDEATKVNSANPGWVRTSLGGSAATMSVVDGAKTSVILATLTADGPSGGFFHMQDPLPF
jgi:NAD(P)-dependent dehydrogenase (short-subunit alcohol dehydrogenase family)